MTRKTYTIQMTPATSIALVQCMGWTTVYDLARVAPGAFNRLMEASEGDRMVSVGTTRLLDLDARVYVHHSHADKYNFSLDIN